LAGLGTPKPGAGARARAGITTAAGGTSTATAGARVAAYSVPAYGRAVQVDGIKIVLIAPMVSALEATI
jgi:hypothetical protein